MAVVRLPHHSCCCTHMHGGAETMMSTLSWAESNDDVSDINDEAYITSTGKARLLIATAVGLIAGSWLTAGPQSAGTISNNTTANSLDVTPWHGRRLSVPSGNDDDIWVHRPPLVGIIGGIGPLADVRLAQLIVELDNKRCLNSNKLPAQDSKNYQSTAPLRSSGFTADACHTPYLLYSNPRCIPNNNLANLGLGPSSVDALVDSAKTLASAGANVIGMACTAAHTWRDEVERRLNIDAIEGGQRENESVKVLDLLDLTAAAVADDGHTTVGLVEVDGTIRGGKFEEAMRRHGIEPILPGIDDQIRIMEIVSKIKRGEEDIETLKHGIDRVANNLALKNQNITAIVFGCTDIAAIMGGYHGELDDQTSEPPIQFYNTLQVLAEDIIRISN